MEEIVSLPPMEFFNNDYQSVLDFIEDLGYPKFKIAGSLDLYMNHKINTLGSLVEVEGYLDMEFTNIKELPENLKVHSHLQLIGNDNIKELPNGLSVHSINAQGTEISKIGNITIGNRADFSYMFNITSLPDNFNVPNSLKLSFSNISEIPKNLTVGGRLYLKGTPLVDKLIELCGTDDEELLLDYLNSHGCNINDLSIY